jgi:hypothetical protein
MLTQSTIGDLKFFGDNNLAHVPFDEIEPSELAREHFHKLLNALELTVG